MWWHVRRVGSSFIPLKMVSVGWTRIAVVQISINVLPMSQGPWAQSELPVSTRASSCNITLTKIRFSKWNTLGGVQYCCCPWFWGQHFILWIFGFFLPRGWWEDEQERAWWRPDREVSEGAAVGEDQAPKTGSFLTWHSRVEDWEEVTRVTQWNAMTSNRVSWLPFWVGALYRWNEVNGIGNQLWMVQN